MEIASQLKRSLLDTLIVSQRNFKPSTKSRGSWSSGQYSLGNKLINNIGEYLKQIFSQYNSTERKIRKTQGYYRYSQQHAKNDTW
jgi:predicted butyrate kinase (DUF1464 family)